MNRKKKWDFLIGAVLSLLAIMFLFKRHSVMPITNGAPQTVALTNSVVTNVQTLSNPVQTIGSKTSLPTNLLAHPEDQIEDRSLWRTPLIFYGKVIDEKDQPIPKVNVSYSANSIDITLTRDEYNNGTVETDPNGIFEIRDVRGIGLMLKLSHPDFYPDPQNRNGYDIRGRPKNGIAPTSQENAQVFRMHHKGHPVALIGYEGGLHQTADGSVMNFPLHGKSEDEVIGNVQIQAWKQLPDPANDGHYDWKVQITIPNGGILETTNKFDFVAPDTGYQSSIQFNEAGNLPKWKPLLQKTFFIKMPNFYIRARANIDLFHDLYFSMNYVINPSGSRNLEPAQ